MKILITRTGEGARVLVLRDGAEELEHRSFRRLSHRAWGFIRRKMEEEAAWTNTGSR